MNSERKLEFDRAYLRMAFEWAKMSRAIRLKVGAIMVKNGSVISDGFNGTPSGFNNCCERVEGCTKIESFCVHGGDCACNTCNRTKLVTVPEVLHAEANAITKVAKSTNSSEGATLYITDSPCFECSKLIIQAGIKRVVYVREYRIKDGIDLLRKAGIIVEQIEI